MNLHPLVIKRILTGATAFGALLPWATLGPISVSGTSQVEGELVLLAGLLGLFLSFTTPTDPRARTFEAVLAGAAVSASGWFWLNQFGRAHLEGYSAGYGLLVCFASAVGWAGWLAWDYQRSAGRNRRPRGTRDWR